MVCGQHLGGKFSLQVVGGGAIIYIERAPVFESRHMAIKWAKIEFDRSADYE